ncbi:MAG: 16S rRNA (cytosine(1402)-N(4))-methyltransferase RsmH [candidate division Zixibacteria bacterium]|nr:16S rRNA (cytosine(1402)-N(4))-methyltransferase RsmH [candidate division Zixibacteria bacterium]
MTTSGTDRGHQPVMAREVVRLMATNHDGAFIDLTVGSGGHLKAIAAVLGPAARLYGLDKDPLAVSRAGQNLRDYPQFKRVVQASYADLASVADLLEDNEFDGILMDLGISSDQLDDAGRGFSFRYEGLLDMRYNSQSGVRNAADLVNTLEEKELAEIIGGFGEERLARRLAAAIVRERRSKMIRTTFDLARIVTNTVPPPHRTKSLARVFQAFRIAVNSELEELTGMLPVALSLLKEGGRLGAIAYHSLEDRIVKRFFQREEKGCICPPNLPVCVCGRLPGLKIITRKAVKPDESEKSTNPRSRSARFRVAEKIN